MKVTFFYRKPYNFHFSIELLFNRISSVLKKKIAVEKIVLPYHSEGLIPRIKNGLYAYKYQTDINHITGDIHFISPFFKKKKTINTYHDFTFLQNSKGIVQFILWFFWVYIPVKRSAHITVFSEFTKTELLKYVRFNDNNITVIPNVISSKYIHNPKIFNNKRPTILHIGTTPNKNIEVLIEAIKSIPCRLVVIGKLSSELKERLNVYKITYHNYFNISDNEMVAHYKACDMLSFCSLNEGFGLPILEAQATGRPVITSNISSMPEVAGKGAILVNPYKPQEIKEAILKILSNTLLQEELINKGLQNVKKYHISQVVKQYLNVYKMIYNRNNKF